MKTKKSFMNYKNDLDECLTFLNYFLNVLNFRILFSRLPNLLLHFNLLLGKKVPKLPESYGIHAKR